MVEAACKLERCWSVADSEAVNWPSRVAKVALSSFITVLFKISGSGMSNVGWFKDKVDRLFAAATQEMR